jgi:hypothetical protein
VGEVVFVLGELDGAEERGGGADLAQHLRGVGAVLLEDLDELVDLCPFVALLQAEGDGVLEHEGVAFGDAVVGAVLHLLEELVHAPAAEGRLEAAQLVHDASEGPDVAVEAVGVVVPDLGTGVVRSAGLRERQPIEFLGDVEVADLDFVLGAEEDVGGLEVAVDDVGGVQVLESCEYLHSVLPDLILEEPLCVFEACLDELGEVALRGQLHHDAQVAALAVEERLPVLNDVRVLDRRQDSDLIQRVLFILLFEVHDLHLNREGFTFFMAYYWLSLMRLTL